MLNKTTSHFTLFVIFWIAYPEFYSIADIPLVSFDFACDRFMEYRREMRKHGAFTLVPFAAQDTNRPSIKIVWSGDNLANTFERNESKVRVSRFKGTILEASAELGPVLIQDHIRSKKPDGLLVTLCDPLWFGTKMCPSIGLDADFDFSEGLVTTSQTMRARNVIGTGGIALVEFIDSSTRKIPDIDFEDADIVDGVVDLDKFPPVPDSKLLTVTTDWIFRFSPSQGWSIVYLEGASKVIKPNGKISARRGTIENTIELDEESGIYFTRTSTYTDWPDSGSVMKYSYRVEDWNFRTQPDAMFDVSSFNLPPGGQVIDYSSKSTPGKLLTWNDGSLSISGGRELANVARSSGIIWRLVGLALILSSVIALIYCWRQSSQPLDTSQ